MRRLPVFIASFLVVFFGLAQPLFAQAQSSLGIANYLTIHGSSIKNGDIISFANNGYFLSKIAYDPLVVGVVTDNPAVAIVENRQNSYPVVSTGNVYVIVSGENGAIHKNDLITTTTTPGVGAKAVHSGYVIGTALQDFPGKSKKDVAIIAVSLDIHYFSNRVTVSSSLLDVFSITAQATYEQPTTVLKYFVAAVIVIFSFVFGFWFFGRTANKGIEAIGRNPLAGRIIQLGILFNVVITVAIIAAGLVTAFFVLRL